MAAAPLPTPVAGTASCMVHELRQLFLDHCSCRHLGLDVLDRGAGWEATPICSPLQMFTCAVGRVQQLFANASQGLLPCRSACVTDSIRVTATYEQLPADDANSTAVTVFYPEMVFTSVTAVVPGFIDWYQGVGGVAGLFFGMSVLSLWELIIVAVEASKHLLHLLLGSLWNRPNK